MVNKANFYTSDTGSLAEGENNYLIFNSEVNKAIFYTSDTGSLAGRGKQGFAFQF